MHVEPIFAPILSRKHRLSADGDGPDGHGDHAARSGDDIVGQLDTVARPALLESSEALFARCPIMPPTRRPPRA